MIKTEKKIWRWRPNRRQWTGEQRPGSWQTNVAPAMTQLKKTSKSERDISLKPKEPWKRTAMRRDKIRKNVPKAMPSFTWKSTWWRREGQRGSTNWVLRYHETWTGVSRGLRCLRWSYPRNETTKRTDLRTHKNPRKEMGKRSFTLRPTTRYKMIARILRLLRPLARGFHGEIFTISSTMRMKTMIARILFVLRLLVRRFHGENGSRVSWGRETPLRYERDTSYIVPRASTCFGRWTF